MDASLKECATGGRASPHEKSVFLAIRRPQAPRGATPWRRSTIVPRWRARHLKWRRLPASSVPRRTATPPASPYLARFGPIATEPRRGPRDRATAPRTPDTRNRDRRAGGLGHA